MHENILPSVSGLLTLYNIVCFRCSDGMDRHRQEWLDYACSEEVLLDIKNEYLLISHFSDSCMYYIVLLYMAEQKCNL